MNQVFYFYLTLFSTLFLTLFLPESILLYVIIIFGQAHFIITYFYKNKGGKLDKTYINNFLYFFALLFIPTFFIVFNIVYVNYYILFTSLVFVLHYFYDEMKIFDFKDDLLKTTASLAVFASFSALFFQKVFVLDVIFVLPLIAISVLSFLYTNLILIKNHFSFFENRNLSIYLFIALNVLAPIVIVFFDIGILKITGFIIIFHYIRWYLFYYDKFSNLESKKELNFYLDVVLWTHVFVISLFVLYSIDKKSSILFFLFSPIFFYTWTLLHIILSIRKEDYSFLTSKEKYE